MAAPIKHTCPDIDRIIETFRDIQKELDFEGNEDDTLESLRDTITKASDEINPFTVFHSSNPLEDLRSSNSKLRDWGEGLEEQIDEKDKEIDSLNDQISTLEWELNELKEKVIDLESEVQRLESF